MDTSYLLILHSYYRWVVLAVMVMQGCWLLVHRSKRTIFSRRHFMILLACTMLYNVQGIIGLLLYCHSPLVKGFLADFGAGVKNRQLRFFGMEHITMMLLALIFINIVTLFCWRKIGQQQTFATISKCYLWIYLMILASIPWSFSPLTSRPNFR
ncbi:hypothetical protein [Sphingobacterium suaedae]|uniref:Uncharacterized protein n=1 Tax=Sphingobacterium suaedae TaxID=1686402 RepID=A0ABW5KEL2_9SPHI